MVLGLVIYEKKALTNISISLARDNFPGLIIKLTSNAINKFERNINGKGAVKAVKGFTLFIWNQNINDIIKIIKSLKDLGVLTDGVNWNRKTWNKKQQEGLLGALLATLFASLVKLVISSLVNGISGIGVRKAGRGYMDKNISSTSSLKQYRDYKLFQLWT